MSPHPAPPQTLRVDLADRSYDIVIGRGVLGDIAAHLRPVLKAPRVAILTDSNVGPLYLEAVVGRLEAAGITCQSITVPAGEATKSFEHFGPLLEELLAGRIERSTTLVALGGGVIGDLGGFAASVLLRGIDYVQIPTSLLAQVDSSVGGKTAINSASGKNLIGAFYQPRLVVADTLTLDTLPRRELLAGYAEVVKYGLLGDAGFYEWLEGHGPHLIDGDDAAQRHAVAHCCAMKAEIVNADEREHGQRALLNLGHTFGHALESIAGFDGTLLHGESVAAGCCLAFDLSARLGLCPSADAARVRRHFASVGLPTGPYDMPGIVWEPDHLIELMGTDKKVRDGRLVFILVRGIGDAFVAEDIDVDDVRLMLTDALAA
jgi:3-dehydroquinate synthase